MPPQCKPIPLARYSLMDKWEPVPLIPPLPVVPPPAVPAFRTTAHPVAALSTQLASQAAQAQALDSSVSAEAAKVRQASGCVCVGSITSESAMDPSDGPKLSANGREIESKQNVSEPELHHRRPGPSHPAQADAPGGQQKPTKP